MQLSKEQSIFIKRALERNNILVDACIGSGKTTAIQYLCNAFPNRFKKFRPVKFIVSLLFLFLIHIVSNTNT